MSTGMRPLLDTGMGSGLLAEACPVVYMFGNGINGLSVINPMSIGTTGLLDPAIGNGLLAMNCPLV